jgi:hypothetical protein
VPAPASNAGVAERELVDRRHGQPTRGTLGERMSIPRVVIVRLAVPEPRVPRTIVTETD